MAHNGFKFMPKLDAQQWRPGFPYPPLEQSEWRLGPGTSIRALMADLHTSEYDPRLPGDDYWIVVYEVFADSEHVATAASLEAALAVLDGRYVETLPF